MDPAAKKALETVEQLRMELQNKEKEATKERHSRAEIQLMASIDSAIKENEYDLIEHLGEQSAVREYMEEMYAQTGEIPDVKDACEAITNHLVEQFSRVKDSKWLKPKEPVEEVKEVEQTPKNVHTISNKLTQSTQGKDRPLTAAERMAAAIAVMKSYKK